MNTKALLVSCMLSWSLASAASQSDSQQQAEIERFHSIMASSVYPVAIDQGFVTGPGADWLRERAREAQFFVIGEQHATADIALFSQALYRDLVADGYRHMALEVGPWSTRFAERMMRRDPVAFEAFMADEKTYLALVFLFYREENELAFDAVRASETGPVLWGLDQEFIAAAPILLPLLETMAKTEQEAAAVAVAQGQAEEDPMWLGMTDPSALNGLRRAFESRGSNDALELIDAMILSNRIYMPFTGRGGTTYQANLERENYMKANFLAHFRAEQTRSGHAPKVFLKFGAFHGSRGRSGTNVPALGDFLAEWGRSEGYGLFNLHIDCNGGQGLDIRSGQAVDCKSYYFSDISAGKNSLQDYFPEDGLAVIDLRGLRPYAHKMGFLDQASVDLIYAYDAFMAMPNVSPATGYKAQ